MPKPVGKLTSFIHKIKSDNIPAIVLLGFLSLAAYGLLIPWIGYYWDDWVFAWTIKFLGPKEFIPSFLPFRPFLGPIFAFTTSIFGSSPLAWQIFGLFIRFGTGLAAYWSMQQIWPKAKLQTLLTTLLFVVYPGYNQQWVALTHINQEMISLIGYLLSLGFMVKAIQAQSARWKFSLIALLLAFVGLYPTEYFFGLELLRPFIIWFVLRESITNWKTVFSKTILYWLPYLLLWISNAIFLVVYHNSSYYNSYGLKVISISEMGIIPFFLRALEDVIQTIITTGMTAWVNTLSLMTKSLSQISTWLTLGLIGVSLVIVYFGVSRSQYAQEDDDSSNSFHWQAMLLGLLGILAGRLPSWIAGLPLRIEFSWDRFMVSMLFGASLLFIGLVDYMVQKRNRKILIASIFIAFAVGWQFMKANSFRREWESQQLLFWELSWRAPGLKPGTILVTHELPFEYVTDQSLTAPLNWVYAPEIDSHNLPYMLAYTKARLGSVVLPSLQPGAPISVDFRTMQFSSNTDAILVIYQESPGCLRVMDAVYSTKETIPGATYMITDAISYSNPDQIIVNAPQPVLQQSIFGKEPGHTWCYYFEKAELARQTGNWTEVVHLADEANQNGYSALQPVENLVFIEGYAMEERLDDATRLTRLVVSKNKDLAPALCQLWDKVENSISEQEAIATLRAELSCGQK